VTLLGNGGLFTLIRLKTKMKQLLMFNKHLRFSAPVIQQVCIDLNVHV